MTSYTLQQACTLADWGCDADLRELLKSPDVQTLDALRMMFDFDTDHVSIVIKALANRILELEKYINENQFES